MSRVPLQYDQHLRRTTHIPYPHAALKLEVVVEADLERSTMASMGRSSDVSLSVTVDSCARAICKLRTGLEIHKEI